MRVRGGGHEGVPSFAEVMRAPAFLPTFLAASLSTWGDYIARITVAAVVFERTVRRRDGRDLRGRCSRRCSAGCCSPVRRPGPTKYVLIGSHLIRALFVVALLAAVLSSAPVAVLLVLLFVLELAGGPAAAANQMLLTDLFPTAGSTPAPSASTPSRSRSTRRSASRSVASSSRPPAPRRGCCSTWRPFVAAAVLARVIPRRDPLGEAEQGLRGFARDVVEGGRHLFANRVLTALLLLSVTSTLAMAAPEAVAIPYVNTHTDSPAWGGLLMAAPILGAVVGLLLMSRMGRSARTARCCGWP